MAIGHPLGDMHGHIIHPLGGPAKSEPEPAFSLYSRYLAIVSIMFDHLIIIVDHFKIKYK